MDTSKRETAWQRAIAVATRKHDKQLRKDGKTPYASHPMRVAFTIRHVFDNTDETALVAALLHDTIEDTTTDYDELVDELARM